MDITLFKLEEEKLHALYKSEMDKGFIHNAAKIYEALKRVRGRIKKETVK